MTRKKSFFSPLYVAFHKTQHTHRQNNTKVDIPMFHSQVDRPPQQRGNLPQPLLPKPRCSVKGGDA